MQRPTLSDKGGIITERGNNAVTVRLRIPGGMINSAQIRGLADISDKYHTGLSLTVRQTIELYHVDPSFLRPLVADLEKNGTPLGSERTEVVNITACAGTNRCMYALIDSLALAKELDSAFFGRGMPVKTRIGVSSCPYSCMSEQLSEIGITGVVRPYRREGECTGCDSCTHYCKEGALSVRNGILHMDMDKCILCGLCVISCPYEIIHADPPAYQITVGGKRGLSPSAGRHLVTVKSPEWAVKVVGMVVDWIYRYAWEGSLLYEQMDELDFDLFKAKVWADIPHAEVETWR